MLSRLICLVLGHDLYVYAKPKEEWAKGIRWLKCRRCKESFAMNDKVPCVIPMDFELVDMHEWEGVGQPCPTCGAKQGSPCDAGFHG